MSNIDELRDKIDAVDNQILQLLAERADIAGQIGERKATDDAPVYDPAREAELLDGVAEAGAEPLPAASVRAIYRQIVAACRGLQELTVAYLGPRYTHTYFAALQKFGHAADLTACRSIEQIFDTAARGSTEYGIVPIENSLQGVVGETCDLLLDTSLNICAEMYLPIHHALLAGCPESDITVIYSHPQVFAQCRHWLRENLPDAEQIVTPSTAVAARRAANEANAGALAAADAADPVDLNVIAENIEDRPDNRTRFFIVGHTESSPTGDDKTSIVFSTAHRAGSLYSALEPFNRYGMNMTLIQSRPTKQQPWEYVFFVDFEGHIDDREVSDALDSLRGQAGAVHVLGSYPTAETT